MFACFGFRARHKGLTSSGHSDVELRAPLTPKDGVPLNTHNHHHKHVLYHYYNNSLHRSSLNSSRRNSQASTASVSEGPTTKGVKPEDRRKSLELTSRENVRDGLKITDLDDNTTDIIRCNENLIAVLKEDKSKPKSGKKKNRKKFNTLPRNLALQSLEDDNNKNNVQLINDKNDLISEILNNNDFPKVNGIISVDTVRVSTSNLLDNESSSRSNIPKFQGNALEKKASQPKSPKSKSSKKESKKQDKKQNLNRSLSPTDLDSFMAQTNGSFQGNAKYSVSHTSSTSLKGSLPSLKDSIVSKIAKPSTFSNEDVQARTTKPNVQTPHGGVVQSNFLKQSETTSKILSDSKLTKPTVTHGSLENCNASLTNISAGTTKFKTTDLSSAGTTTLQTKIAVTPGLLKEEVPGKIPLLKSDKRTSNTKLPTKKSVTKYVKANSDVKVPGPSSYTRLPIALDRKPTKSISTISLNGFLSPLQAPKAESEDFQSSSPPNKHNSDSAHIDATPNSKGLRSPLSLLDPNDSSIPLIDFDDETDTFTPDPTSEVREDASEVFVDGNDPPDVSHTVAPTTKNKQDRDAFVPLIDRGDTPNESPPIETLLGPDQSDSSLSADHLSQRHRVAFRRKKRKQSDNEPEDEQPVKTTRVPKGVPGALSAADAAELKRLEAEVSSKSSEAEQAKREAEEARSEAAHAGKGLEALTVLVHHLTHQYEAFSNPVLKAEIARLQACLQEAERALGESRVALEAAETRLSEERASAALQQNQLEEQHGTTLQRLQEEQQHQLQQIKDQHLKDLEDLARKHQGDTLAEQELHRAEVVRLEAEHERKLSEVCRVHGEEQQALRRDLLELGDGQHLQVSEVLATHATREQELQARSTSLQKEHDRLKEQSKKLQDSLLSDNDHRVTALKNYCTGLQQEVDSLKSVVEMRNSELHKLRAQVSGMEQLQRDLDAARQCANTLQAKTEDLNAQMDAKAKAERQLLSSNRQLLENMNRESTLNKQLRLENEQLQWKLRQREQLSTSLPMSTLDLMTRVCHLNTSWEERPASLHHQQHPLRENQHSAALSKGTARADGRLATCSPQDERCKQQQKDQTPHNTLKAQRTGDGESPPSSPCVKAVVEKSNSVSFILDLNDSLSDDSYLEFPASPRLKHGTPTFSRKAVQKSRSSSLDKKIGGQIGKNIALAKCTSAGNFFGKGPHSVLEPIQDSKPESIKENGSFLSDNQLHERSRRLHSTSESSGGADSETLESSIERVSPSGLAWTVPMNGSSPSSPRSPCHSSSRDNFPGIGLRHLQQPEEDEYEENLEDSEDAFINGIHPDITPLVNLMNTSSSSPSDSELSRCGSQAGLTSESDEESSLAEGDRPEGSLSPEGVWLSQGAGEAMVPSELVVQCGGSNSSTDGTDLSTKVTPTKDVRTKVALAHQASSASFSNGEANPQDRLEEEQRVV